MTKGNAASQSQPGNQLGNYSIWVRLLYTLYVWSGNKSNLSGIIIRRGPFEGPSCGQGPLGIQGFCVWPLLTGRPIETGSRGLVTSEAAGTRIRHHGPVWSGPPDPGGHYQTSPNDKEGQTRIDKEHANLRWPPSRVIDQSWDSYFVLPVGFGVMDECCIVNYCCIACCTSMHLKIVLRIV